MKFFLQHRYSPWQKIFWNQLGDKPFFKSGLALLFGLFISMSVAAQNPVTLTGTVVDDGGISLPGVSVTIKGTNLKAGTDNAGKFSIATKKGDRLVFTMIGYATEEVVVGDQNNIRVILKTSTADLDQVVVVGYGQQKRTTLTGAVSSVTNKEIVTTKNENVQNMLTGKIAGVRVIQNSGEPGALNTYFDVRGMGAPLIVVDGVVRNNFSRLSAEDVESITVLKDASAAIYGVRSANGVVLITTKKGKKGTVELNYNGSYSLQKPSYMPKSVDIFEYMTLVNELQVHNTGNYVKGNILYTPADFTAYANGTKVASDWNNTVLRYTAPQQQHDISASGGNENTNYFASLGVQDQEGFFKSGDLNYNRYNLRANLTTKLAKNLTFDVALTGIVDQKNQLKEDTYWVIRSTWYQAPVQPMYANNNPAYLYNVPSGLNGIAHSNADISGYRAIQNKWFQSATSLNYDAPFLKGFSLKGLFSYDYQIATNKYYTKAYNLYNYNATTDIYTPVPQTSGGLGTVRREFYEYPSILFQASANFNRSFGSHNVSGLFLYERNTLKGDNFYASRNVAIPLDQLLAGSTTDQVGAMSTAQASLFNNQTASYVGKFTYDFKGKYLFEAGFRADGTSKFAVDEQWGFFPYASAGYRLSEEQFWKNSVLKFVNNFKIRASYGKQGDDISSSYQFITGYNYPSGGAVFNGIFVTGAGTKGLANPLITWYTSKQLDIGADVEMWNGLFGFSIDYFRRNRTGLLGTQSASLPDVVGVGFPQENMNGDLTRGIDLEVNHRNQLGKFFYSIKGTMGITRTMNTTRVQARAGNSYLNWDASTFTQNRWNNLYWGYGSTGQFEDYNAIKNSPIYVSRSTVVGDYRYEDWNGDGVISAQDSHPISTSGYPTLTYGATISASYKNWDFNTTISGAGNVYASYFEQLNQPLWAGGNALKQFLDRYHPEDPNADPYNPNTKWVSGHYAYTGTVPFTNTLANAQNAKYFRIKTIELGYSLPQKWFGRTGIKGLRFYANGYNIFTITDVVALDPEHPPGTSEGRNEYGYTYPVDKKYTFGLNLKL